MAGKDKNIRTMLSGFLRYRGKGMSNLERNAFEKELEKDPFAGEAAEGFSDLTPEEVKKDLATLQKRLKARSSWKHRFIYYRIAASIAVLIGISSLFIIIQRNKPEKLTSDTVKTENHFDILRSPALSKPVEKEDKKIAIPVEQPAAIAKEAYFKKEAAGAVSTIRSENAVQVIGYIPPQPVHGKENFDKYIEENIRRPADAKPGELVVEVSFKVKNTGIPDSIKIISSPGKSFSDEAIRLIKSGPLWKPAEKNGKITVTDIRVTIVFK